MKRLLVIAATLALPAGLAAAADLAAGQQIFERRCATCHTIVDPAGNTLVDGGREGPNQYGLIGRKAGTYADFDGYGDTLVAVGNDGLVWSETEIVAYLADPRAYLREKSGDNGARSKMAYKLRDEAERVNVAAYLATFR